MITYAFFLLFAIVKVTALVSFMHADAISWIEALQRIWDEETQALFAAVMAFWFGSRHIQKMRRRG